jgi:pyruvate dehydrogenase E1 component alpha subunit
MLGEGAVNQGVFHESLNLASLWRIPVVYLIENNGYSMGTSQERSSAGHPRPARRAYNMGWYAGNGNSIYEARSILNEAMTDARDNHRPSIVELWTYRYRGHSMSDPDKSYRTKEEIENYKKNKDPITLYEDTLKEEGILDEEHDQDHPPGGNGRSGKLCPVCRQEPLPTAGRTHDRHLLGHRQPGQENGPGHLLL